MCDLDGIGVPSIFRLISCILGEDVADFRFELGLQGVEHHTTVVELYRNRFDYTI